MQPSPLSNSKTFSSTQREGLSPHSSHFMFRLFSARPCNPWIALQLCGSCLSWTFYINGMLHFMAFVAGFLHSASCFQASSCITASASTSCLFTWSFLRAAHTSVSLTCSFSKSYPVCRHLNVFLPLFWPALFFPPLLLMALEMNIGMKCSAGFLVLLGSRSYQVVCFC